MIKLPAELRFQIYDYLIHRIDRKRQRIVRLVVVSDGRCQWMKTKAACDDNLQDLKPIIALSRTCKMIYLDIAHVPYDFILFNTRMLCDNFGRFTRANRAILDARHPLFRRIKNLDLTTSMLNAGEVSFGLACLRLLSKCLDEAGTHLDILNIKFSIFNMCNSARSHERPMNVSVEARKTIDQYASDERRRSQRESFERMIQQIEIETF